MNHKYRIMMCERSKHALSYIKKEYQEIKHPTVFTLTVLGALAITIRVLSEQIGMVERVLLCVFVFVAAQKTEWTIGIIRTHFKGLLDKLALVIICFGATFCKIGMYYIESDFDNPVFPTPFLLTALLWVSVLTTFLTCKMISVIEHSSIREGWKISVKEKMLMFCLSMALCMLSVYAFNPAITSPDSHYCYNAAFHLGEEPISDGFPIFYLLLLKLCTVFNSSILFMVVVQAIYYSAIVVHSISTLSQIGVRRGVCWAVFLLVFLGFSSIIQVSTLWKDIPFATSLLWLTSVLVRLCNKPEQYSHDWKWHLQFLLATYLTALIRHNGLLPAMAVLFCVLCMLRYNKRIMITVIVTVIAIWTTNTVLYSMYQVTKVRGLKFYAMTNDVLYLYYNGFDLDNEREIIQLVNDATDYHPDEFEYNVYYTNVNRENMEKYTVAGFMQTYLHAWIRYPKGMLRGFLSRNSVVWSVDKPPKEVAGCVNYLQEYHGDYKEQYPYRVPNRMTVLLSENFSRLTKNQLIYTLYWRTAIYNMLMISLAILVICRNRIKSLPQLLPFIPILVNVLALLISSGWPDYRYYWPSMLAAAVVLPYGLMSLRNHFHN